MSDEGTVAVRDTFPALTSMMHSLFDEAPPGDSAEGDKDAFVMRVMEDILTAESFDDVFAAQEQGMVAGKDFTGRPFYLRGDDIQIRPSTITGPGGFTHFAIFRVTEIATGETVTVNCGGKSFMAALFRLRDLGYFLPEKGCPEEGRPLVLKATESDSGTEYLSLLPFKVPTANGTKRK